MNVSALDVLYQRSRAWTSVAVRRQPSRPVRSSEGTITYESDPMTWIAVVIDPILEFTLFFGVPRMSMSTTAVDAEATLSHGTRIRATSTGDPIQSTLSVVRRLCPDPRRRGRHRYSTFRGARSRYASAIPRQQESGSSGNECPGFSVKNQHRDRVRAFRTGIRRFFLIFAPETTTRGPGARSLGKAWMVMTRDQPHEDYTSSCSARLRGLVEFT